MSLNEFPLKFKRGNAADWTSLNPVLKASEKGYEEDTQRWKTGDGSTGWNQLQYDDDIVTGRLGDVVLEKVTEEPTVVVDQSFDDDTDFKPMYNVVDVAY